MKLKHIIALNLIIMFFSLIFLTDDSFAITHKIPEVSSTSKQMLKEKKKLKKTDTKFTKKKIFKSTQSELVVNKDEIKAAGPVGGATQALNMIPGVRSETYGPTGATRGSFSINGIQQGWGGLIGETDDGSDMVTFDGVPMVNPGSGLWSTAQIPELSLIQGINVTYGPGNPASRWYNSLGGTLNFVPIQPTVKPGADISMTFGSFDTKSINFNVRSGLIHGYSLVLAGGTTSSNSFRTGFGFYNPTYDYSFYGKLVKTFYRGNFAIGAYVAHSEGYRPTFIPVNPIYPGNGLPGVTVNGYDPSGSTSIAGPLFSEATTGFYSSLPYDVWNKLAHNYTYLVYSPLNLHISKTVSLHNLVWYRQGNRLHDHYNDFTENPGNLYEYNNPEEYMYGDKIYLSLNEPYNLIKIGGYWLNSKYVSRNAFYNPTGGYCTDASVTNAVTTLSSPCAYRYSDFYQTFQAAFVQDRIHPISNLRITPGIRFVTFHTSFYNNAQAYYPEAVMVNPSGNDDTMPGHSINQAPNASTAYEKLEPSIGANYKLTKNISFYANYSVAYQNPHLGGGGGPFQQIQANILQPEKNQYESVGFKVLIHHNDFLNDFVLNANYYHEHFSNEDLFITLASGTTINTSGNSNYQGVNLYAEDDLLYNLHLFTNINVETAKYETYLVNSTTDYNGSNVPYVPNGTFNLGVYYKFNKNGIIYSPKFWDTYTGKQYIMNDVTGAPTSHQTIPDFNLLNASFSVKVPFSRPIAGAPKMAEIKFTVLNLLNKQYNEYEYITAGGYLGGNSAGSTLAYPGMPISAYATLNLKF
jgi:iron complex outermembrane receptor protein